MNRKIGDDINKTITLAVKCCLCGKDIDVEPSGWREGHNAEPLAEGRCCSLCNTTKVIPERIRIGNIRWKKSREKKWGFFPVNEALKDAFDNAQSDLSTLAEEMRSWEENMSQSEGLSATNKYERVSEAADNLENGSSYLDDIVIPAVVEAETVVYNELRRRNTPRWVRLSNILAQLNAVKDYIEEYINQHPNAIDKPDLQSTMEDIETAISEIEGVEFPSMFG